MNLRMLLSSSLILLLSLGTPLQAMAKKKHSKKKVTNNPCGSSSSASSSQQRPSAEDNDLKKALALSLAEYKEMEHTHKNAVLSDELYAAYVVIAEEAKETGLQPHHQGSINKIVERYFKGTQEQRELVTTILGEDLKKSPLKRCLCDDAPLQKRITLLLDMKARMRGQNKEESLVHTSFGSGYLLQDFWAIRELQKDRFSRITVNLIDTGFNGEQEDEVAKAALKEFAHRTRLNINLFDDTKKAVLGAINVFSNAYDYCRVCLEKPEFKSMVMTMIDPLELSSADNPEEVTMLAIYPSYDNHENVDDDGSEKSFLCAAALIVSYMNQAQPRIYMHQKAFEDERIVKLAQGISQVISSEKNPQTIRTRIEKLSKGFSVGTLSNPLIIYRDMVELALHDRGIAYIIADEIEPVTKGGVKILDRSKYAQDVYNTEASTAEEMYFRNKHYIDL